MKREGGGFWPAGRGTTAQGDPMGDDLYPDQPFCRLAARGDEFLSGARASSMMRGGGELPQCGGEILQYCPKRAKLTPKLVLV